MKAAVRFLSVLFGAPVLAAALAATGSAQAADLILDCNVHANQADHGRTDWRRRLVISPSTHMVEIFDDFGEGLKPRTRYRVLGMDGRRITLENGGGKIAYIDRQTHIYHLSDTPRSFTLEGPCVRAGEGRGR
jgi:hypothetical protein